MGTSGSYGGGGGKFGDAARQGVGEWVDSAPAVSPQGPAQPPTQPLDPAKILPIIGTLQARRPGSSGGDGPGGGGGGGGRAGGGGSGGGGGGRSGGGASRSVARSAGTAGRAAAAAFAFRAGDAGALGNMGLDYAELAAIGDSIEVTRRIVDAACGPATSTIEDHEQRLVAADVAEWVLEHETAGAAPTPEEIVRHTIGVVIAEAALSETGEILSASALAGVAESQIRDAAEALAQRAELSISGATEAEFSSAIESGIETLRAIMEGGS